MSNYYQNKQHILQDIFGTEDITFQNDVLQVQEKHYPIVHDVIVLLEQEHYTEFINTELQIKAQRNSLSTHEIATDIQYSFGEEWKHYPAILAEHEKEFYQYFDIVDLHTLQSKRVCDLGCGSGRWSYFLKDHCQTLILIDFSDAIFTARTNLRDADNCLFFMGDLQTLPFTENFVDFLFCLGVLHHLPTPCLEEVKKLKKFAAQLLIFLYYALDNRPFYFRLILEGITLLRKNLTKVSNPTFRKIVTTVGTYSLYVPLIYLGHFLKPFRASSYIPLYDFYQDKSIARIKQDVYDRLFTRIEQRVTRKDISQLRDTFSKIIVSENLPYWHFLCER